jgi:YidC/Oxa1 family membrane protein insertase
MDNSGNQNQSRFLAAAAISMAVLFGWSYFFAPQKPAGDANANVTANANTAPAATPQSVPTAQPPQAQPETASTNPDTTPNRSITIRSPLYEVKLDSKGAVATSWVLIQNKSPKEERPLWADGSTESDKMPLQLISPEALSKSPREVPFRLSTDDASLNALLNERNYEITGAEADIVLAAGQEKQVDFKLIDGGVEVTKTFLFRADSYVADLSIKLTKGGQSVPNTKLLIGASIGDHAIKHHSFYHIEPEAVAHSDGSVIRHPGASFTYDSNNQSVMPVPGNVDWAGVADAYFAMAAVPAQRVQGVEYRATKYEFPTDPYYDGIISWVTRSQKTSETRHLITAYIPIAADGSKNAVYTGTKDYFALSKQYDEALTTSVSRPIDLVDLINFSNYSFLRPVTKTLSIPILYSLNFFNGLTHNYGVAIIVFTFLFYSLLFPLRWSQSRSFKKASGNAPKMKAIQDKIKDLQKKGVPTDDPRMRELQMQQLKMTKDALPIGGCLPMLLQFPLLIAFYTAVTVSLDIRQASFIWLPDLSAADPYHFLEFAFAASMILSMKFTPQAATVTPEQQMQQKMMTYFMPVMMLWVMWSAPSGLLLYWFFGNLVSFGQQMVINRLNKNSTPPGAAEVVDSVPKNAKPVKAKFGTA